MNNGWISLHRKLADNPIYRKSEYLHVWIHILFKCNHSDSVFIFNNQNQTCKRGEFITGRKQIAQETGIKEGTVEVILNYLESQQQIQQQKTNKFRLIKVVNYESYQSVQQQIQQQTDNKLTTNQQQTDTNNKSNKNNKENKDINILPEGVSIIPATTITEKTKQGYTQDFLSFYELYPRKVSKFKASLIWKKMTAEEREWAINAIKIQAEKTYAGRKMEHIPHPTTWLNGKEWESETQTGELRAELPKMDFSKYRPEVYEDGKLWLWGEEYGHSDHEHVPASEFIMKNRQYFNPQLKIDCHYCYDNVVLWTSLEE